MLAFQFQSLSPELNSFFLLSLWYHLSPNYPVLHLWAHWFTVFSSCMSFTGCLWILPSKYLGVCLLYLLSFSYLLKTSSPLVVYKASPLPQLIAGQCTPVVVDFSPSPRFLYLWADLHGSTSTHCLHGKLPIFPQFQWNFFRKDFPINLIEIRPYTHTHTLSLFLAVTVFLQTMLRIFNCILRAWRKQWRF